MKNIGLGDRVKTVDNFAFQGHYGEIVWKDGNFVDVVFDDYKPTTCGLDPKARFRFRLVELERL